MPVSGLGLKALSGQQSFLSLARMGSAELVRIMGFIEGYADLNVENKQQLKRNSIELYEESIANS
ncbi:hypothetical protein METHB2_180058 [Candidatus Methylobacter favarea]|uniref:Uncharacterized protein n=1 Tax=Candidatus Methylobacter favarea TaxID=2707345 RepID=A0A8S0X7J3_9GAMM|nr:hypothetical protein [Candidatus Methylobacter favarea]CAA9890107.1 hypothetical protein METHB2_180058 [Candidatus Methylobacter favarea]